MMKPENIKLPEEINGWRLDAPPSRIDESNIFEYMNGAGELYLGYHFDHLTVYEYRGPGQNSITVELYQMEDSSDAFGLLSMDWSGEAVTAGPSNPKGLETEIVPPHRALYGKGLLRAWSDDLYLRILASREIPGVKETILQLLQSISRGRDNPEPPTFLQVIKPDPNSSWIVNPERTAYFYSYLVLNSFYYLSHENILNLDSSTEAMILTLNLDIHSLDREKPEMEKHTANLLVIRYSSFAEASRALTEFFQAYIPELPRDITAKKGDRNQAFFKLEDGWMAYRLVDNRLALALACPDQPAAFEILEQVDLNQPQ